MFDKQIGNDRVKEIFQRLIRSDRLPNSLLLTGDKGVGKKQFAIQIAKSFFCQNPKDLSACNSCLPCKRATKFAFPKPDAKKEEYEKVISSEHPDIKLVIPRNRNILVDAIRDLEKEANFRPTEARKRFFIIDDAEKMNDASSNALLKTLEEPPETSYIFLITSRPMSLLQTIRSRCQSIHFSPIEAKEIEEFLLRTQEFSPTDVELISKLSRGSVGRALKTDLEKFRAGREAMLKILKSLLLTGNRAPLLQIAEEMNNPKAKEDYEPTLDILQTLIHDVWSLNFGKTKDDLINSDIIAELAKLAQNADNKKLAKWLNEIEILRENLNVNLNRKIATDALFMQMANA
jgi:DNA polymerase-3 subunit delta'